MIPRDFLNEDRMEMKCDKYWKKAINASTKLLFTALQQTKSHPYKIEGSVLFNCAPAPGLNAIPPPSQMSSITGYLT